MKILFLSSYYPPHTRGGAELSTYYLATGLRDHGHDVNVITSSPNLPLTAKPLFELRHARRIAGALKREIGDPHQYDIVHAHDFRSAQALSELGWENSVVTARDYAQICGTTNDVLLDGTTGDCCSWQNIFTKNPRIVEASLARKFFRIWQYKYNLPYRKKSFLRFPAQIFISKAQQQHIASRQDVSQQKTAVIYNPVPPEYLSQSSQEGIPGTVVYIGTVERYKGVGVLLHAWKKLIRDVGGLHLKIVGDGAQKKDYERLVERWGLDHQITFTGRLPWDRLRRVYDEASVVVAPHLWLEPFGRTVVEAMARGKVVVASNIGGPAEIIQDNKTGLLFEKGSVESLQNRLKDALTMPDLPRRTMQANARQWVQSHLTSDTIAKQHEEFYRELGPV